MAKLVKQEHIEAIAQSNIESFLSEDQLMLQGYSQINDRKGSVITLVSELLKSHHGFQIKATNLTGRKIWTRSKRDGSVDVYITILVGSENKGFTFNDDKEVMGLLNIEA